DPGAGAPPTSRPIGSKKIVAAIRSAPASMSKQKTNPPGLVGSVLGLDALEELVHTGLTHNAPDGTWQPVLAEQTPSIENGLWRLFADGRMETTWRIRADARGQRGGPGTAERPRSTMMARRGPGGSV